jgi:hypothetical protein
MGHGDGEGQGQGHGGCCGCFWAVLWFLVLVFIGWPVAFLVSWIYVLLLPFSACILSLKLACHVILKKAVQLPLTCAENMIEMKSMF